MTGPTQQVCPVIANEPAGAYRRLVLGADRITKGARPGQFVAVAVGGATSGLLLRRSFSIHAASDESLEVVVAAHAPGTAWITERAPGDLLDVVGPLGQPFPLPEAPTACVLVGGGYGSAPLFWLARELRAQGHEAHLVLGAAAADRLFGAEREADLDSLTITTDDGSLGQRGWVSDVLANVVRDHGATVLYACGPMPMLRAVSDEAQRAGATAYVAVEEAMACGVGICMTCVMPVVGDDGRTRMMRSCLDGPVLRGDRVRWDAFGPDGVCRVPDDCVGSPAGGGH